MAGHDLGSDATSPFNFAPSSFFMGGFGQGGDELVQDIDSRIQQQLQAEGPRLQSRLQLFQLLHQLPTCVPQYSRPVLAAV